MRSGSLANKPADLKGGFAEYYLKGMDMKQKLKTSLAFAKNLFVTGAIMETSRQVEIEICRHLPKGDNRIVVEFGMGHGNITREILKNLSPTSRLYAFEVKESFCEHVRKHIVDDRLVIIPEGAEHLKKHLREEVHGVISSIPFSFFSKEKSDQIIRRAYELLAKDGYYSQVLYTKFNYKKFERVFDQCELRALPHFPTEYIYHCRKG